MNDYTCTCTICGYKVGYEEEYEIVTVYPPIDGENAQVVHKKCIDMIKENHKS